MNQPNWPVMQCFNARCRDLKSAAIVGFIFLVHGAAAQAAPPVPNAGFEEDTEKLLGWTFSTGEGGAGHWEWDTKNTHSGQRALRLVNSTANGFSTVISDFIPVQAGKSYEVRSRVHVEGRARAKIYFMVTQYAATDDTERHPNAFGTVESIYTGAGWKPLKSKVDVREGSARIRIHVIVTQAPQNVTFDDFEIVELNADGLAPDEPKYQPRHEKPKPEELPPLEPAKKRLQERRRAVAERRMVGDRARFFVDGKPLEPGFYVGSFWTPHESQIADFKNAGVRVYYVPLVLGRGVYGNRGPWIGKDKTDFSEIDDLLWRVLRVDPDGYVMFYMATDPYREWGAEHPTEVCTDQHGKKAVVDMHPKDWGREPDTSPNSLERYGPTYVSSVLREQTSEVLRQLARHVNSSLPGKAVIGYAIAGGNDGGWAPWIRATPGDLHLADYSEGAQREFRAWLRRLYQNDASTLKRAWNRPDATFENAQIPSGERRLAPGFMLDPSRDQDLADYNRFYSEGLIETIQIYARALKQESGGKILTGSYYDDISSGYEGHQALGHMLQTPDIDYLIGTAGYAEARNPGGAGRASSVFGSTGLQGRIFLTEQDWRSWLVPPSNPRSDFSVGRAQTAEAHNAMVRRESGMMLAFGQGTWWYDMGGGWFADPGIMKAVREAREAFTRDLQLPQRPRADVAVFIDERGTNYLAGHFSNAVAFRFTALQPQIYTLNQAGVPYHLYLQSELTNKKLPDYKLYIFLNPHHISSAEFAAMKALRRDGKTFVWVQAPGMIKPAQVGATDAAGAIAQVTGIEVRKLPADLKLSRAPVASAEIAPGQIRSAPFNAGDVLYNGATIGPSFAVSDEKAMPLGVYSDGSIGVAARDFGNWKSVFFSGLGMSETFVNSLARWAGAWVAASAGDAVYASQNFLTVHAMWDGEKKITLLQPSRITDLSDGKVVAASASTLTLPMKRGETRWFFLQPAPSVVSNRAGSN